MGSTDLYVSLVLLVSIFCLLSFCHTSKYWLKYNRDITPPQFWTGMSMYIAAICGNYNQCISLMLD